MTNAPLYYDQASRVTVGSLCWKKDFMKKELDADDEALALFDELGGEHAFEFAVEDMETGESVLVVPAAYWEFLVRDRGKLAGVFSLSNCTHPSKRDSYKDQTIRDCAQLIHHDRAVDIQTPFAQAIHLFDESDMPYWVMDNGRIYSLFTPNCLFRTQTLFCYFAITLDLEIAALNLCTWHPESWNSLTEKRKEYAKETYKKKVKKLRKNDWLDSQYYLDKYEFREYLTRDLMQCTTFIDKMTMLKNSKLLIDQDDDRLKKIFMKAEKVRNACAHPLTTDGAHPFRWKADTFDLFDMTADSVSSFVKDCLDIIDSIILVTSTPEKEGLW